MVLAGGTGRRLGGADKPGLLVGGRSLLDRVLDATSGAATTVVVGPQRATTRPVVWTREDPIGGGPVAALSAGLPHVTSDRVVLVAADLPFLSASLVTLLAASGNAVVAGHGQPQWLCGGWETRELRDALVGQTVQGARLADVLGPLRPAWVTVNPADPLRPGWLDVDTEDELRAARALA